MAVSANASPESFSTTRRYWLAATRLPLSLDAGLGYLTPGPLRSVLVLADLDAREPADGGVRSKAREELTDGSFRLLYEGLLEQDDVLEEAVQAALDDLGERLLRLAFVAGELFEHRPLLVEDVGGDVLAPCVVGGGRR